MLEHFHLDVNKMQSRVPERNCADGEFQSLLESASDAMVIVNKLGEIILVNSQTENLFGYPREELLDLAKIESGNLEVRTGPGRSRRKGLPGSDPIRYQHAASGWV